MTRLVFFPLLLFAIPSLACLYENGGIRSVYYRGNHQRVGSLAWHDTSDIFATVSLARPRYMSVRLDKGAVLADTLVLQSGAPEVASPINLPLILDGEPGVTIVALPDAVRIVRWVAGESTLWLEIRQSSDEWLSRGGTLMGPDGKNQVSFSIGLSARESDHICQQGVNANLPFASRDAQAQEGDYAAAITQLLCVDLRGSYLEANGTDASFLSPFTRYWDSDANQGNGVYQAGTSVDCILFGLTVIAVGYRRECDQTNFVASAPTLLPGPAGTVRSRSRLTASFSCTPVNLFTTYWAEGSRLMLRAKGEHAGFELHPQIGFAQGWSGIVQVRPETAFSHNGLTLYREAELIYVGPDQATTLQDLDFDLELLYPLSSQYQPTLEIETYLQPLATPADSAPYDGAHQHATCEDQVYAFPAQTVALGGPSVPTLSPLALMALIVALPLLAFYQRRRRPVSS